MTIRELESKIWDQDGVRIVIRDHSNRSVDQYPQRNAAQGNWRITQYLENRIQRLVKGREVVVVDGSGKVPHGGTLLKTLRESYN